MTTTPIIEPPKENHLSAEERQRLIEESATQLARLFLEQVLENMQAQKRNATTSIIREGIVD